MKKSNLCAVISAFFLTSLCLHAQTTLIPPNGDFQTGAAPTTITNWAADSDASGMYEFEYRLDAGPSGVGDHSAVIKDLDGVGTYAILISNDNNVTTLASLGLSTGNVYQFSHDMKSDVITDPLAAGAIGGLKVDFFSGGGFVSTTGDIFPDAIGDGTTWENYTYDVAIPSGVDGIKVALLWGTASDVLFDNVSVNPTPIAAFAPSDIPNKGFEVAGGDSWGNNSDGGTFNITFPATGGESNSGYAQIEDVTAAGGFAVLVANSDNMMTLNGLGLTAGNTYKFSVDMSLLAGTDIGGLKVDFFNGSASSGSSGDLYPDTSPSAPSSFATYDFEVTIPSTTTGIKLVLLWGPNSTVCFDNVAFDPTPIMLPPVTEVPNKRFDDLGTDWFTDSGFGAFVFDFPSTGGSSNGGGANPGGHATIEDTDNSGFAVLVGDNNGIIPTADIGGVGLTPGESYVFSMDMKLISGTNLGGLKVEFFTGLTSAGDTGDMRIAQIAPAGDWQTYDYTVSIPSGVDGIKVVPLWGADSKVGYDNICIDATPVVPPVVELINPDFEEAGGLGWAQFSDNTVITFPATGGNPGGYASMSNGGTGFGVIVSNGGSAIPMADLGLAPNTTITIMMDMRKDFGSDMGTMKVEYLSGSAGGFPDNEVVAPNPVPLAADGTWATYTFNFAIPATINTGGTVDGIKIVPIAGINSDICFDNIVIVVPTSDGDIVLSVDSFDAANNMIMLNLTGMEAGETYSIFSSSTLSGGVTSDTAVDVTDATSQPFAVPADELMSPGFFQAKQD